MKKHMFNTSANYKRTRDISHIAYRAVTKRLKSRPTQDQRPNPVANQRNAEERNN